MGGEKNIGSEATETSHGRRTREDNKAMPQGQNEGGQEREGECWWHAMFHEAGIDTPAEKAV